MKKTMNFLKHRVHEDSSSFFTPGRDGDKASAAPNGISCLKLLPETSGKSEVHHPYEKTPNVGARRY